MANTKLLKTVGASLLRMLARKLDGSPAADELPMVAAVLTDDLVAVGYDDESCERVAEAIAQLGRTQDRWPTPRQVIAEVRESARRKAQSTVKLAKLPTLEERERMRGMAKQLAEQCRAPKASAADRQVGGCEQLSAEQEAELLERARKQYEHCKPPEEKQS